MNDRQAYAHAPLYISELQETLNRLPEGERQAVLLYLTITDAGEYRELSLPFPLSGALSSDIALYETYLLAMMDNMLVTFGGVCLDICFDTNDAVLYGIVERAIARFDLDAPNNYRTGYGVYINYINRMNRFLGFSNFSMRIRDIGTFIRPEGGKLYKIFCPENMEEQLTLLRRSATELTGKCICSLDVGGNSIKGAVVIDGEIAVLKEYQWYPTAFRFADEMNAPILLMLRFLNAYTNCLRRGACVTGYVDVLQPAAAYEALKKAVEALECAEDSGRCFDAVVIGFPDIVVNNKVAGGESYKQLGLRNNPETDYETEFLKTSALDTFAKDYVKEDGLVVVLNDGNAASFIISVEQAFLPESIIDDNGMFAHTIGTEMGTGFISRAGTIQNIPLEGYQHVIDLGNLSYAQYEAGDVRSTQNLNTAIPGTVQKYISQLGLFRMAVTKLYTDNRPLFDALVERGLLAYSEGEQTLRVPMHPVDKRSELTKHLIGLLQEGNEQVAYAFRTMGKAMGVLIDQGRLTFPEITLTRLLSGGLVACDAAYDLIREGLHAHNPAYEVLRLDENTVASPLLKKMTPQQRNFNVAIGSAYIANRALLVREEQLGPLLLRC